MDDNRQAFSLPDFVKERKGQNGFMNYNEAMEYMELKVNKLGSVLGLDTICELLKRVGNPQEKLNFIHVAGTNGKGSVSTMIANALIENGYRIGRYISPVIDDYRERIQVNNHLISKEGDFSGIMSSQGSLDGEREAGNVRIMLCEDLTCCC